MDNERTLSARDVNSQLHPYTNLRAHERTGPHVIVEGDGPYVIDEAGNRILEGVAGLWCASLGFSNRRLVEAATRQMETLPYYHQFGSRAHAPGIELAEKLLALAPGMGKVFFVASGSEANDTAIKIVRYYQAVRGKPKKTKVIGRHRAYHGVTLATAALTGLPWVHEGFDLPSPDVRHTMSPHFYREAQDGETEEQFADRCAEALDRLIAQEGPETVGAMIAEPLMGAGGVIPPPATYWDKIQAVLKRHDVLLIADEVINGFGRTGAMWGSESYGLRPDLMTCAKQLSSAYLPIAATMVSDEVYQTLLKGSDSFMMFGHGYTYGGHPVCCAVALETLKIYEEMDVLAVVRGLAPRFAERVARLKELPLVGDSRAVGLIGAAELMADKDARRPFEPVGKIGPRVGAAAIKRGVFVRVIQDILAFCPPYVITEDQIDALFDGVEGAIRDVADELARERAAA